MKRSVSLIAHSFISLLLAVSPAAAQNLSDAQLGAVILDLREKAQQTWEIGTECEALTEYLAPSYGVFNASASTSVPPAPGYAPATLAPVLDIARAVVANRSASNANATGPQPLVFVAGGAAGDPASIGVAVLLANWTGQQAVDGLDYAGAARDQLEYLMQRVPQTSDGAISHRVEQVQLWSDSVYMVPPFLAYYGATTANQTLLAEAYTQAKLYRSYLYNSSVSLWRHIVLGNNTDPGHWSTGNAWAAAGMLRVLGTIQHSAYASAMQSEASDLVAWVGEIHAGMYARQRASALFTNYADDGGAFEDASSTALLASTVYRLALLADVHTHLPNAERARIALSALGNNGIAASASTSASASAAAASPSAAALAGLAHFTSEGILTPVVDPYDWASQAPLGTVSPEGQAFVVEMQAAWRDWVQAGTPGASAALPRARTRARGWAVGGLVGAVLACGGVV